MYCENENLPFVVRKWKMYYNDVDRFVRLLLWNVLLAGVVHDAAENGRDFR